MEFLFQPFVFFWVPVEMHSLIKCMPFRHSVKTGVKDVFHLQDGNKSDRRGNPSYLEQGGLLVSSLPSSKWFSTGIHPSR